MLRIVLASAGAPPAPHKGARTSDLLLHAVRGEGARVSVGDILSGLDSRAFGLATLIFSVFSIVPMPPGIPTVVGIALFIVSFQMVIGRKELWLPGFLTKRSFEREKIVAQVEKLAPRLQWVEKVAQPRLTILTGRVGTVVIGFVILVMAVILILPLPPGGNFPPALACAIMGMGLAERDGAIVLLGLAMSVTATIAVTLVTVGFVKVLPHLMQWIHSTFPF